MLADSSRTLAATWGYDVVVSSTNRRRASTPRSLTPLRSRTARSERGTRSWANLTGTFHGIKAAIGPLRASDGGPIVTISSTAGINGYGHMAGHTASKFGVRGLTKAAALDLGRYGVRVNSVHPGVNRSPMTEGVRFQERLALGRPRGTRGTG
ncbi:SDR family NAD(P)-dependent oxidoreductase [Streptomyces sp. NPDC004044]